MNWDSSRLGAGFRFFLVLLSMLNCGSSVFAQNCDAEFSPICEQTCRFNGGSCKVVEGLTEKNVCVCPALVNLRKYKPEGSTQDFSAYCRPDDNDSCGAQGSACTSETTANQPYRCLYATCIEKTCESREYCTCAPPDASQCSEQFEKLPSNKHCAVTCSGGSFECKPSLSFTKPKETDVCVCKDKVNNKQGDTTITCETEPRCKESCKRAGVDVVETYPEAYECVVSGPNISPSEYDYCICAKTGAYAKPQEEETDGKPGKNKGNKIQKSGKFPQILAQLLKALKTTKNKYN